MINRRLKVFSSKTSIVVIPTLVVAILLAILIATYRSGLLNEQLVGWRPIPLPELSAPLQLDVVHVVNARFPVLDDEQLQQVLRRSEQLAAEHFSVQLLLRYQQTLSIDNFFRLLPEQVRMARKNSIIDPANPGPNSLASMRESLYQSMRDSQSGPRELIDYARPYLINPGRLDDLDDLAGAAIDAMLIRLRYWYGQRAADGRPVLDDSPYNQWVWWDSIGYGDLPAQVVITNQLIASLENYDQALHTSLRGGINGGTMTFSRTSPLKGYVFLSTYALLNDNPMLAQLKNDRRPYSRQQVIDYAAATLTHELGHLLFHYGHPFGEPACIMAPTPLLQYREWYAGLDAEACRAAAPAQMRPGAARILYNPAW
jgi:hypothetical protein